MMAPSTIHTQSADEFVALAATTSLRGMRLTRAPPRMGRE